MLARDRGAGVEQEADELLRARLDADEVALIREGRRAPLDRLVEPWIGAQEHLARALDRLLHRVVVPVEPCVDLGIRGSHRQPFIGVPAATPCPALTVRSWLSDR